MDMTDVRKALWRAYEKLGIEEKKTPAEEGFCALQYPSLEDADYNEEKYLQPKSVLICSPILFPDGTVCVTKGDEGCKINRFYWKSPDIFKKAVEIIDSWVGDLKEE